MKSKLPIVYSDGQPRDVPQRNTEIVSALGYVMDAVHHTVDPGVVSARFTVRDSNGTTVGKREHIMYEPGHFPGTDSAQEQANDQRWNNFWKTVQNADLDSAWTDAHIAAARDAGILPGQDDAEQIDDPAKY